MGQEILNIGQTLSYALDADSAKEHAPVEYGK
jgi:hypothetical protein